MTTPTELSEAHLQDHELISAALEASSLSPRPTSSTLPPFLTSASEHLPTAMQDFSDPSRAPPSPTQHSPDLLTTPRTDSSRPLSSPPILPNFSTPVNTDTRNTVKFTLLKKDSPPESNEVPRSSTDRNEEDGAISAEPSTGQLDHNEEYGERTESQSVDGESPLDPVLFAALNHHRDRFLLLRAEVELERFLANPSMTRLPLAPPYFQPALNSYQRLLVHRLADTFGITREVEAAPPTVWNAGAINPATGQPQGVVVLVKGENTRLPPAKLATYAPAPEVAAPPVPSSIIVPSPSSTPSIASSPITSAGPSTSTSSLPNLVDPSTAPSQQPTAPQILKILPRSNASRTTSSASSSIGTDDDPATSSSAAASSRGKGRRELTLEEREAAYKEARERIFSQPEQEQRSAAALPSSSSVASEDIGTRLASVGAGITRPSSAGSTFSRSSAALSVAGGRPSPSVASESGSSMWSGHHGGIYGGGSQLMPSLRHSAATFDPNLAAGPGWTQEYGNQYPPQDSSWQHQQYQPQYSHPPIQVTGPPAHSPYPASSPSYASSPTSSFSGPLPPHPQHPQSQPFPSSQSQFGPIDAWGRNIPPPLPSPSLSTSSGSSIQRRPAHLNDGPSPSTATSERSTSANSGYLMRFADTGAVVTPGGTVTPGPPPSFPSPSSSVFVAPPSTARSISSFSSTSQQSFNSSSGGTSRSTGAAGSGVGGGRGGNVGSTASPARRPSTSLASSTSSVRSGGDRRNSQGGLESPTDLKKRDRQTTIRRQSPAAVEGEENAEGTKKVDANEESSPLHPSLPPKPVWVASKPPRPRSPPPPSAQAATSSIETPRNPPATVNSTPSPSASYTSSAPSFVDSIPRHPQAPYQFPTNPPQPNYYPPFQNQGLPPASHLHQPTQQQGPNQTWNRPTGMHYPAAPSFVSQAGSGQYPIGGGGGYPSNPVLSAPSWSYAHPPMPPTAPTTLPQQQVGIRGQSDAMPFADIRRPPPKSTQLFDPNRPAGGAIGGSGMRRVASGAGSVRSVSGTRANLE